MIKMITLITYYVLSLIKAKGIGMNMKKSIVTGIRATGIPHIGNYIGSIKPIIQLQEEYTIFQTVADLHSIPHVKDANKLSENIYKIVACYLACGLDVENSIIWRQSQINEMAWISLILSIFATAEEVDILVNRQNNRNMDIVSYLYPILMAADTLLINPDYVFSGIDHKENLEFIQNLALRFNKTYGEILKVPEPFYPKLTHMLTGLDGRKMSKSFNNTIPIIETEEKLYELIMKPHLYLKDDGIREMDSILELLSFFTTNQEFISLKQGFDTKEINCDDIRHILFTNINNELSPIRQRYSKIIKKPEYIDSILNEGLLKAQKHASNNMKNILDVVGFSNKLRRIP